MREKRKSRSSAANKLSERKENALFAPAANLVDPTFQTKFETSGSADTIANFPDGKHLVCGDIEKANGIERRLIVKLNSDGSLDQSFNFTATNIAGRAIDFFQTCTPLTDGKVLIVIATYQDQASPIFSLVRLNADGSLDDTFALGTFNEYPGLRLNLLSNGKILFGGGFTTFNGVTRNGIVQLNGDGSLDTSFDSGTGFNGSIAGLAVQTDGKIIAGGGFTTYNGAAVNRLVRLNPNGSLDATFNAGGTGIGGQFPYIYSLEGGNDGKIYISGDFASYNGTARAGLARLNTNGSLDLGFTSPYNFNQNNHIYSLAFQPDGKILLIGYISDNDRLIRLNSNGTVDNSFNSTVAGYSVGVQSNGQILIGIYKAFYRNGVTHAGIVRLNSNGSVDDGYTTVLTGEYPVEIIKIAEQSDGKVVVGTENEGIISNGVYYGSIVRLNPNGSVDTSFSFPFRDFNDDLYVEDIEIQSDGKILAAGDFELNGILNGIIRLNTNGVSDASFNAIINFYIGELELVTDEKILVGITEGQVIRLNTDGTPDSSFTTIYSPILNANFTALDALTVQPDGKIIAAWYGATNSATFSRISRYTANGSVDSSLGTVQTDGSGTNLTGYFNQVVVQPDGKILVAGQFSGLTVTNGSPVTRQSNSIERLNPDGSLDTTFAPQTGEEYRYISAVALQADGKILHTLSDQVIRLNSDGTRDSTFNAATEDGSADAIMVDRNGKILIGGYFEFFNGQPRSSLVRLFPSGRSQAPFDFDGDGRTDIGIFRPAASEWWYRRSGDGVVYAVQFGTTADRIVPGDYTGDGKADVALWRPSTGEWLILRSEDNSFYAFPFGSSGDVPVPGDYDGDGRADAAVFRPSNFVWYIIKSGGGIEIRQFGANNDIPAVGDYDGDGKTDIGIFRANGTTGAEWWYQRSSNNTIFAAQFGTSSVKPVVGDYTGDGKADIAFFDPSNGQWYVLRSEDGSYFAFPFGASNDIPVPGDYDGDGKWDAAVFRSSTATWYLLGSSSGVGIIGFGISTDKPIPSAYIP